LGQENYTYVTFEVNTQPTVPILLYPSNLSKIGNSSVVLGCNGSTDLQGDTIYYAIYADTSNPPTTLVAWRCNAEDGKSVSDYADPYYFQMDSTRIHNATLSYDSSITEGASIYVEVNVTINKWNTNDIFSNLTYNGTDYTSSKELLTTSADEDVYKFYNTLIVPDVGGTTTLTGYWNFTLLLNDGTTEINDTYSFSQTVEETALFAYYGKRPTIHRYNMLQMKMIQK